MSEKNLQVTNYDFLIYKDGNLNDGQLSEKTSVGISDISSGGRKPKIYNFGYFYYRN